MTDVAPDTGTDAPDATETPDTGTPDTDWQAEAEKYKALARKHEDRAKANSTAARELDELRRASMTDLEKAVAEAKATGRAEALAEAGAKVAAAEFKAAAAGRLDDNALSTLLDGLNLSAFLGDDGDVDSDRVAAFIDGIAPPDSPATDPLAGLDLGQGARSTSEPMALNGDPLLKAVTSRLKR